MVWVEEQNTSENAVFDEKTLSSTFLVFFDVFFQSWIVTNKQPLTIVSPGTQMRNFTHIDDIISGLILIGKKGSGDNYGIGCSKSHSILDIAKLFRSEIEMLPERKGNRMSAKVVCGKTQNLGWYETKTVEEYINNIVNS